MYFLVEVTLKITSHQRCFDDSEILIFTYSDECEDISCNNGTCKNTGSHSLGNEGYRCECDAGYSGQHCEGEKSTILTQYRDIYREYIYKFELRNKSASYFHIIIVAIKSSLKRPS